MIAIFIYKSLVCAYFNSNYNNRMIKRGTTPLSKDKFTSRNTSNHNKPFKDIRNVQNTKPSLSRNPSNSKLLITPMNTEPLHCNPESADRKIASKRAITD